MYNTDGLSEPAAEGETALMQAPRCPAHPREMQHCPQAAARWLALTNTNHAKRRHRLRSQQSKELTRAPRSAGGEGERKSTTSRAADELAFSAAVADALVCPQMQHRARPQRIEAGSQAEMRATDRRARRRGTRIIRVSVRTCRLSACVAAFTRRFFLRRFRSGLQPASNPRGSAQRHNETPKKKKRV